MQFWEFLNYSFLIKKIQKRQMYVLECYCLTLCLCMNCEPTINWANAARKHVPLHIPSLVAIVFIHVFSPFHVTRTFFSLTYFSFLWNNFSTTSTFILFICIFSCIINVISFAHIVAENRIQENMVQNVSKKYYR